MPSQDVRRALRVHRGGAAISPARSKRFYVEGASMRENLGEPRVGRDGLVAHERAIMGRVQVHHQAEMRRSARDRPGIMWRSAGRFRVLGR